MYVDAKPNRKSAIWNFFSIRNATFELTCVCVAAAGASVLGGVKKSRSSEMTQTHTCKGGKENENERARLI